MEDYNKLFNVTAENWEEKQLLINRYIEIKKTLKELDEKATRPLRAIISGIGTDTDKQFLLDLENEAVSLRNELNEILRSNDETSGTVQSDNETDI